MLSAIIYLAIGAFIGWNLPQPSWAKTVQVKVTEYISSSLR